MIQVYRWLDQEVDTNIGFVIRKAIDDLMDTDLNMYKFKIESLEKELRNTKEVMKNKIDELKEKSSKNEKELEEAKSTIQTLRQDLQEVNLLNAKYLYMNKLFKAKSLSESQKVKVINALDRASTVNEVKNTYETLKESFNETKKAQLKESIGFASQAAGVAPKATIVDADPFINRWQTLAGIKKS
jgi:DNA repair exonuclease SbcCD ATPase subunit